MRLLRTRRGIESYEINYVTLKVSIKYNPYKINKRELQAAIERAVKTRRIYSRLGMNILRALTCNPTTGLSVPVDPASYHRGGP